MSKKEKVDYFARWCSAAAILIALFALWQTQYNLRPIVSLTGAKMSKNTALPTGGLDITLMFTFENRGASDIQHLTVRCVSLVGDTALGPVQRTVVNRIAPGDIFRYPIQLAISKSAVAEDINGVRSPKQHIPIRLTLDYRSMFRKHTQVFDVSWNKDMNELTHCEANGSRRLDDAMERTDKNSNKPSEAIQ
jgi:hypothetical protein